MHLSCHLATILYTFFSSICMLAKIYNQLFSWNFFFGENNRKLLYGSLTLLKVNLLTENPFLTCSMPWSQKCQSLYEIVFEYSSLDFFLKLSVMNRSSPIETAYKNVGAVSCKRACDILYNQVLYR